MARATLRRHATYRTETCGAGTGHEYQVGYSWCDPNGTRKVAASRENGWRGSIGIYSRADQDLDGLHQTNCPECSKRWGKDQLDALGDRVLIEKIENPTDYEKSTYRVSVDGVPRGYVWIERGFGTKWNISRIHCPSVDRAPYSPRTSEHRGPLVKTNDMHMLHYSSVNALASLFPSLVEQGKLPTADETSAAERKRAQDQIERDKVRRAEQAERDAARAKQAEEAAERRSLARDAVKAISERAAALGLSNSETMGLLEAIKIIG